jgi:hypothetical protein
MDDSDNDIKKAGGHKWNVFGSPNVTEMYMHDAAVLSKDLGQLRDRQTAISDSMLSLLSDLKRACTSSH